MFLCFQEWRFKIYGVKTDRTSGEIDKSMTTSRYFSNTPPIINREGTGKMNKI